MDRNAAVSAIDLFRDRTIMVIGDLIADEYIFCETARVSREAPVLILQYQRESIGLGGALNVVSNLAALGAKVYPVGILGMDPMAEKLIEILGRRGVCTEGIIRRADRTTITKTRVMACSLHTSMQQVLRIDRGESGAGVVVPGAEEVESRVQAMSDTVDAVILSDYGYGVFTDSLLAHLRTRVESGLIVSADSRFALRRFHHLTVATPNEPEVQGLAGYRLSPEPRLAQAGQKLREELGLAHLLITRGKMGMALFSRGTTEPVMIPVFGGDEVTDVTGAGDTVIAVLTLALASGLPMEAATRLSNMAGGIVVTRRGAATVAPDELRRALSSPAD
jgi:D-glycero-beta-D-manno-heptose-7-phosphate kinase